MLFAEIIGNLGQEAEVKTGKNGKPFLAFSIAHTEKRGEQEETIWVRCMYYNENLKGSLTKGKRVYVNGDLNISVYNGKPDVTLFVNRLQLL